jgi:hypothetical protein
LFVPVYVYVLFHQLCKFLLAVNRSVYFFGCVWRPCAIFIKPSCRKSVRRRITVERDSVHQFLLCSSPHRVTRSQTLAPTLDQFALTAVAMRLSFSSGLQLESNRVPWSAAVGHSLLSRGAGESLIITGFVAPIQLEPSAFARGGLAGWVLTLHNAKVIFTPIHITRCPSCE